MCRSCTPRPRRGSRWKIMLASPTATASALSLRSTIRCPGGGAGPAVTEAPDTLDTSAHYLDLFPNFGISTFRDAAITVLMVPESPNRTHWQLDLYFYGHIAAEPEVVDNWGALMHAVFLEDKEMIEDMQVGRSSPVTDDGGLISPVWETCILHLHRLVVDAIERGERAAGATPSS